MQTKRPVLSGSEFPRIHKLKSGQMIDHAVDGDGVYSDRFVVTRFIRVTAAYNEQPESKHSSILLPADYSTSPLPLRKKEEE